MSAESAFILSSEKQTLTDAHHRCPFILIGPSCRSQDPEFQPDLVASKSNAAAGLCSWVVNIVRFYQVYCEVEPKRQALSKANAELAAAQEKLTAIKTKINVSPHIGTRIPKMKRGFATCRVSVSKGGHNNI